MMYASTKDFFKSHLDGLSLEFQASELDDISEQVGAGFVPVCAVWVGGVAGGGVGVGWGGGGQDRVGCSHLRTSGSILP